MENTIKIESKGLCRSCATENCTKKTDLNCKDYKAACNVGTAKMPDHVEDCPFCGARPQVKNYPNNTGASVRCNTADCAAWHVIFDLEAWNKRVCKSFPDRLRWVANYLFNIVPIYKSGAFFKTQEYVCRDCGRPGKDINSVQHTAKCTVKKFLYESSR